MKNKSLKAVLVLHDRKLVKTRFIRSFYDIFLVSTRVSQFLVFVSFLGNYWNDKFVAEIECLCEFLENEVL